MERDTCLDCRHYYKTDTCKLTGRLAEPAYTACGKFTPRVGGLYWWKKENVRNWFDAWKTAQEILEAEK